MKSQLLINDLNLMDICHALLVLGYVTPQQTMYTTQSTEATSLNPN